MTVGFLFAHLNLRTTRRDDTKSICPQIPVLMGKSSLLPSNASYHIAESTMTTCLPAKAANPTVQGSTKPNSLDTMDALDVMAVQLLGIRRGRYTAKDSIASRLEKRSQENSVWSGSSSSFSMDDEEDAQFDIDIGILARSMASRSKASGKETASLDASTSTFSFDGDDGLELDIAILAQSIATCGRYASKDAQSICGSTSEFSFQENGSVEFGLVERSMTKKKAAIRDEEEEDFKPKATAD